MKPLDPDAQPLVAQAQADGLPNPDAQQPLDAPLPPTAASASEAFSLANNPGLTLPPTAAEPDGKGAWAIAAVSAGVLCASAAVWYALNTARPPAAISGNGEHPTAQTLEPAPNAAGERTTTLSEEAQLIAEAQRALHSSTPARAFDSLDQHALRFPKGELVPERESLRVLTLCATGRIEEAQVAQRSFLQRWPASPLAAKLRAECPQLAETR